MSDLITDQSDSIPMGWKVVSISGIANEEMENSFTDGDWIESKNIVSDGIRLIQTGNIGIGRFKEKNSRKFISEETFNELNCKEVYSGDILICRLADPIGRSCIVPIIENKKITSVDVVILRPDKKYYNTYFINYSLNWSKTLNKIKAFASGTTRQRISRKNLGNLGISIPPLKEQQRIAAILSSVDKVIDKIEQIIEQTERVKQGLMQQLLTKGLGHTEFKQTEVGEIPRAWEVSKLNKLLVKSKSGAAIKSNEFTEDGIKVFPKKGVTPSGIFNEEGRELSKVSKDKYSSSLVNKEYLITTLRDLVPSGPNIGRVIKIETNETYLMAQGVYGLKFNNQLNEDFLIYLSNSEYFRKEMLKIKVGSTQVHIRSSEYLNTMIPLPSIEEQNRIVQILSLYDKKIRIEKNKLTKAQFLKQGLMQQLLTGKVRVPVDENEVISQ